MCYAIANYFEDFLAMRPHLLLRISSDKWEALWGEPTIDIK